MSFLREAPPHTPSFPERAPRGKATARGADILCADAGPLAINPIIYAEVSIRFKDIAELEEVLPPGAFERLPLPWDAAFLAGKCFLRNRRSKGIRRSPQPDFYIGAHAAVAGLALLTRDAARYRTYFPTLHLIAP